VAGGNGIVAVGLGGIGNALTVVILPIVINNPVTAIPNQWCIFIMLSLIEIGLWYTDHHASIIVPEFCVD
jgi:hypothetical protein